MKIESIEVVFPTRVVSNEDIVEMIRAHSAAPFTGDLERTLARIGELLVLSGSGNRRWTAPGERPIDLISTAVHRALAGAGVDKEQVDLLIYVGVGKGFLEPAQSYMLAHALGMDRVECFDVLDACMSWTRAMQISESFLASGRYRRILVVNGEFNLREGGVGYPANFALASAEQLQWTFPTYTIGEAATATLLVADPTNPWRWGFRSRPDLADLCTIPTPGFERYSGDSPRTGRNGELRFTSYGADLHRSALDPLRELFTEVVGSTAEIKRVFPHASSKRAWDHFGETFDIADKLFHVYPEYGNLVSASVPAGVALAAAEGALQRGDKVAGWVGSAGMSFAAYTFQF